MKTALANLFPDDAPQFHFNRLSKVDAFRQKVNKTLKAWPKGPLAKILKLIELEFAALFAADIRELASHRDANRRASEAKTSAAAKLHDLLAGGAIPEMLADGKVFSLPQEFAPKLKVFGLICLWLIITVLESINFGYAVRHQFDSIIWGILASTPLFILPVAKLLVLHRPRFSHKTRDAAMIIQALVALLAGAGYLYYSLIPTDNSLAAVLTEHHGIEPQQLRMFCQVIASLCLSSFCLDAAHSLARKAAMRNPKFDEIQREEEGLLQQAGEHHRQAEQATGALEMLHAVREESLAFAAQMLASVDENLNELL